MARLRVLAFDSGVGGLGIVRALRAAVPDVAVTYLADNGFYPYGSKPDAELVAHLRSLVRHAVARVRPDLVVVACNTASTLALAEFRAAMPETPFVGTVPPVKWAATLSASRVIGLLATEATVGRAYLRDLQARFAPDCTLIAHGARGLADLAERRFVGETIAPEAITAEIAPLLAAEGGEAIDVVCLGCTHYGLLLPELREAGPKGVAWLDPAEAVARRAADLLGAIEAPPSDAPDLVLLTAPLAPPREATYRAALRAYGFERIALLDALNACA